MRREQRARYFAEIAHAGQVYDKQIPYSAHLQMVVDVLSRFQVDSEALCCAGWLHGSIEDTRTSYGDIKDLFGEEVAELVYAVINEVGRNRKERAAKGPGYVESFGQAPCKSAVSSEPCRIISGEKILTNAPINAPTSTSGETARGFFMPCKGQATVVSATGLAEVYNILNVPENVRQFNDCIDVEYINDSLQRIRVFGECQRYPAIISGVGDDGAWLRGLTDSEILWLEAGVVQGYL